MLFVYINLALFIAFCFNDGMNKNPQNLRNMKKHNINQTKPYCSKPIKLKCTIYSYIASFIAGLVIGISLPILLTF